MSDLEGMLGRWESAGVLDAEAAERIRAFELERKKPAGLQWQGLVALSLGATLLAFGVALFVSAHWDRLAPGGRFAIVLAMLAFFHVCGAASRQRFHALSTAFHAVGTVAAGAAIALTGQIFNMEEHWPAAILLWALAALAGWALLRDEAQQTLSLLLVPAWLFSELAYAGEGRIGCVVLLGRCLFVWAVLYLTFFLNSRRKVAAGILFGAAAIAAVVGTGLMLQGWQSWSGSQQFLSYSTQVWGWIGIAALPLGIAAFHGHKGLIPPAVAIGAAAILPWCRHATGSGQHAPNLVAHALVAAFAIFLIAWGVRQVSRALVNFGMAGFALSVAWFYFSNIFDKLGRSIGLIGLGLLFLLGGWLLERTRRQLIGRLQPSGEAAR